GRTRLIGTMVGAGYGGHQQEGAAPLFAQFLAFAGKPQHVTSSDPQVKARLHSGDGGTYLWVANPLRQPRPVRLTLNERWGHFAGATALWGAAMNVDGQTVSLTVPARDVVVAQLVA
ncbi:MAG: hypothetical protein KDE53_09125, partial [Caldilineaceae bacterium]|nr:hypothetical protein [Caldilineaceae bacterium]